MRALVRGQGLTDLRDTDGVVMAAPESEVGGLGALSIFLLTSFKNLRPHASSEDFPAMYKQQEMNSTQQLKATGMLKVFQVGGVRTRLFTSSRKVQWCEGTARLVFCQNRLSHA